MTTRSRKVRSCDTTTTADGVEATNRSSMLEAGEVEVVGRLVEQQHVLAREQDGSQRGPRRLAAGEVADRDVEPIGRQADLGQHRAGAGVEVVAADGEEVLERGAVGLDRGPSSPIACIAASSARRRRHPVRRAR